jgi:hypothetical protein
MAVDQLLALALNRLSLSPGIASDTNRNNKLAKNFLVFFLHKTIINMASGNG